MWYFTFSLSNFNFQISSHYDNLFRYICVVSFGNSLTSSLTSSANSIISDLISLSKLFMNIWFGLFGFYGISTIEGYLMPNPLYTYILNI